MGDAAGECVGKAADGGMEAEAAGVTDGVIVAVGVLAAVNPCVGVGELLGLATANG